MFSLVVAIAPLELLGGTYDWLILLVVAILLFGGTRLAGIGKGAGRAIREFKEETGDLKGKQQQQLNAAAAPTTPVAPEASAPAPQHEANQNAENA